ncbi:MAG: hypothetical protein M0P94_01810 [Candidatus Absconditabacterales bacterium]|nr:hypothetical protein [Candidatus Absconditabacterales bacterium]
MPMTIEQIKEQIDNTKTQIKESKDLSPEEKMHKARDLELLMTDIKNDLNSLQGSTTETDKLKEIEELEKEYNKLQDDLNEFKGELDSIQDDIIDQTLEDLENDVEAGNNMDSEIIPSENDKPNWRERNKKTVLIGAGTLGVGLLIRRWWKKRKEKKEGGTTGSSSSEKKPWYKKWRGVGLIGVGGFLGIKWLINHFKKGADPFDKTEKQYKSYLDFAKENSEDYRQYEQLGGTVNNFYNKARTVERESFGFENDLELGVIGDNLEKEKGYEHTDTNGLVPYCLDNYYTNVNDMLSASGVRRYLREKNIEGYIATIKELGADWFNKIMVPYLATFANFSTFGILAKDSAETKMSKFFENIKDNAEDRKLQLDLFFRQYTKILTYMADKKNAIAIQCATPIIQKDGYNGEERPSDPEEQQELLLEAINDKKWVSEKLKSTPYQAFIGSKILGASKVLEEKNLLNEDVTFELQNIIENLDQESEDILGGLESNALFDAEAKMSDGGTLDEKTKNGLSDICDNLVKDMGSEEEGGWMYDTFEYLFVALGLDEAEKQTILEQSGMKDAFDLMKTNIGELKNDILTNPTKENIETLKTLTGEYLAMKKELHLAIYAMQEAKENKDFLDHLADIGNAIGIFFKKFFESVRDIFHGKFSVGGTINFFIGCTVVGGVLHISGRVAKNTILIKAGKGMKNVGLAPYSLMKAGLSRTGALNGRVMRKYITQLMKDGNNIKAERFLSRGIANGNLSIRQAVLAGKKVYPNAMMGSDVNKIFNRLVTTNLYIAEKDVKLFVKYYEKNRKFTSKLFKEKTSMHFISDNRLQKITLNEGMFEQLKILDKNLKNIKNPQANKYFDSMLKKVKNIDDFKFMNGLAKDTKFVSKIDGSNLKTLKKLSFSEIRQLKSSSDFSAFKNGTKNLDDILAPLKKSKNIVKNIAESKALSKIKKGVGQVDKIPSGIQQQFNNIIDETIESIRSVSKINKNFANINIQKLTNLKANKNLTKIDMESLIKLNKHGFKGTQLSDLLTILKSETNIKGIGKLGTHLQELLHAGKIDDFIQALGKNKKLIKNIDIGPIIKGMKNLKNVLKNADNIKTLFKSISKIAKFL